MTPTAERTRVWRPGRPTSVGLIVSAFRRGGGDPTFQPDRGDGWWLGLPTPQGSATLRLVQRNEVGEVVATAWGDGAQWALDHVPALLGDGDDDTDFVAHHPQVARAWKRYAAWHVPRSGLVMHALVPAVIEQKVTGQEAFGGYRKLVHRYGSRAPGPGEQRRLWVAPTAQEWAGIPSWAWLAASVDGARSSTVMRAARVAGRLEEGASLPLSEARRRLRSVPGVGVWTAAEVAQRALGDPDAVSFGDYHVAKDLTWALLGEVRDDDVLAELLEPYRGHRYRVQHLLGLAGAARPRRGPRMAPRTHLPTRR
ncbi:3-methyladenine DNA glycosylase/8-oxoguanine DNA glycosylase [Phycicoccus badiiscoriae]|uniref:3-methyladenine DNA glycosylase/8-oxoguanine DNA glycosylase n=1 Tax=Pedococcus badiiscoriae TaxID=642776 RepID=A0A852WFW1_9MICO|nr:DNA-3-methyladenine glycosylase 2 family protein [Pedococcus badiiscoriae]NYG07670.1 3-methyladenine DNA glycosylase/8-oxoguanine DNA glycosylase [Pedococcus badiiscoriae]